MFSCEICDIFKHTYFYETPTVAASEADITGKLLKVFTSTKAKICGRALKRGG